MNMRWWRLLAVPVAMALVVVGGCTAGGGRDASTSSKAVMVVPPSPPAPLPLPPVGAAGPLVGAVSRADTSIELARLDPRTLRALPGSRLALEGIWPMMAVAPDRSMAVLGSEVGGLTVVDLVHLRQLGTVRTDLPGEAAIGWSWVGRSRLVLASTSQEGVSEVLAVDAGARRVVGRQRFDSVVQGYARLPRGLALLVAPANAIGPARLVVSDASAGLRTASLAEIKAGFRQFDDTDCPSVRGEAGRLDPGQRRPRLCPADGRQCRRRCGHRGGGPALRARAAYRCGGSPQLLVPDRT